MDGLIDFKHIVTWFQGSVSCLPESSNCLSVPRSCSISNWSSVVSSFPPSGVLVTSASSESNFSCPISDSFCTFSSVSTSFTPSVSIISVSCFGSVSFWVYSLFVSSLGESGFSVVSFGVSDFSTSWESGSVSGSLWESRFSASSDSCVSDFFWDPGVSVLSISASGCSPVSPCSSIFSPVSSSLTFSLSCFSEGTGSASASILSTVSLSSLFSLSSDFRSSESYKENIKENMLRAYLSHVMRKSVFAIWEQQRHRSACASATLFIIWS